MINLNLKKIGKRITIKIIMDSKRFMIFHEIIIIGEGVEEEEEVVIKIKALIRETRIKLGAQIKSSKIEMKTEMSIKIIKSKVIRTISGRTMIRTEIGDQKATKMTSHLRDMTITTTTKGNNKKISLRKLITRKEIIIWEKLEVKLPVMMMLIIEQLFIDLNKF